MLCFNLHSSVKKLLFQEHLVYASHVLLLLHASMLSIKRVSAMITHHSTLFLPTSDAGIKLDSLHCSGDLEMVYTYYMSRVLITPER